MFLRYISEALLNEANSAGEESDKRRRYWMNCPACGRRVVKKEIMRKGCYACGWRGSEQNAVLLSPLQLTSDASFHDFIKRPYRISCPRCNRLVIAEELYKNGCFICGYKPES